MNLKTQKQKLAFLFWGVEIKIRKSKEKWKAWKLEHSIMWTNIHIMVVKRKKERIFKVIMPEIFQNLMKDMSISIQETQRNVKYDILHETHTETHYQTVKSHSTRQNLERSKIKATQNRYP